MALPQRSPSPFSVPWICRAPPRRRRKADRHGLLGVVVRMNAQPGVWQPRLHFRDNAVHIFRQRAAIGVAKHDPACARVLRRIDRGKRVIGICAIAVKKMFGVKKHFPRPHAGRDGFRDVVEVFAARNSKRDIDLVIPAFADQT